MADGKEQAFTQGGTEEVRKGELDWVYPEELEITTAYWWAPDSSKLALLQLDERKVQKYPLVDELAYAPMVIEERFPEAGRSLWIALVDAAKKPPVGSWLRFAAGMTAEVLGDLGRGRFGLEFHHDGDFTAQSD